MDWATFFKEYQGIITVVSGFVIALLGYLFGKWNSERTRKWVVRDRQFQQAYASLNIYRNIVDILANDQKAIMQVFSYFEQSYGRLSVEEMQEKITKTIDNHPFGYSQLRKLWFDLLEMTTTIIVLRDKQLSKLDEELQSLVLLDCAASLISLLPFLDGKKP